MKSPTSGTKEPPKGMSHIKRADNLAREITYQLNCQKMVMLETVRLI